MTFTPKYLHRLREVRPPPSVPSLAPTSAPLSAPVRPATPPPPRPQIAPADLPPVLPTPSLPGLPEHLARMVQAAQAGTAPSGMVKLPSGLVSDLTAYVLAWGECWPRDPAHVLRRLSDAYTVWGRP